MRFRLDDACRLSAALRSRSRETSEARSNPKSHDFGYVMRLLPILWLAMHAPGQAAEPTVGAPSEAARWTAAKFGGVAESLPEATPGSPPLTTEPPFSFTYDDKVTIHTNPTRQRGRTLSGTNSSVPRMSRTRTNDRDFHLGRTVGITCTHTHPSSLRDAAFWSRPLSRAAPWSRPQPAPPRI